MYYKGIIFRCGVCYEAVSGRLYINHLILSYDISLHIKHKPLSTEMLKAFITFRYTPLFHSAYTGASLWDLRYCGTS